MSESIIDRKDEIVAALRRCANITTIEDCEKCSYWKSDDCIETMSTDAADLIDALSARIKELEAQMPQTGEWYGEGDGYADGNIVCDNWQCSVCGVWYESEPTPPDFNFCPHCGADMREENNGTTD